MGGLRKNKPALTLHRGRLRGAHACILFHTNLCLTSYANKSLLVLSTLLDTENLEEFTIKPDLLITALQLNFSRN